jgi:5-methylcytosine-specific restriction endonuclease McrA
MKPESVRPVSKTINEVRMFLSDDVLEKMTKMKGRLAHKHPQLSNSELFEKVLDLALTETDPARAPKRKVNINVTAAPRKRTPGRVLRREIFHKANGKCETCGSTHALEADHKMPYALGGLTVEKNLRVLCRSCNARENIKTFGVRSFGLN